MAAHASCPSSATLRTHWLLSRSAAAWADMPAAARSAALASMAGALEERAGEVAEVVLREVGKPR